MITRTLKVLVLGEVPEVGDIFERELFSEHLPAEPTHVVAREEFAAALAREENYDLVLLDITPYGLEVLEQVREHRPACPVVMIADPSQADLLVKAKRQGLEAYLLRGPDAPILTELLAEEIHTQLRRFVEPPRMGSPSADEMYRYAQFHNVLEPFFVVTRRRHLLYVNRAGSQLVAMLHATKPQIGDPIADWSLEATAEAFTARLDEAFAGHEIVCERDFEPLGGSSSGVRELHYQPVTDPRGRVVGVSIAVHQPARPETQRARTMQQLTDLAGGVSHETNNLLSVLMSNADLLADRLATLGDAEADEYLSRIQRAIGRATRFTHQLQAFSRTSVSQPEPVDLNALIDALHASLVAGLADGVQLSTDLELGLPDIAADRSHWHTVITNLVVHGARAIDGGGHLELRTRRVEISPGQGTAPVGPGDYVVVEVASDGRPMDGWMREGRFDPFFAIRQVDHRVGLELATVKSIVEHGGGRIEVEADERTTVRIYYPVSDAPAVTDSPSEPRPAGSQQTEPTEPAEPADPVAEPVAEPDAEPATILLVEDEPFLREAVAELLRLHDYAVVEAATLAEARDQCARLAAEDDRPVDLLITDVSIPGGSGLDLVDELVDQWPRLAVILVSGHAPEREPGLEKAAARHVFLRKPVPIPALLQSIDDLLDRGPTP